MIKNLRNFLTSFLNIGFPSYDFPAFSRDLNNTLTEIFLKLGLIPLLNLPVFKPATIKGVKVAYASLYLVPMVLKPHIREINIPYRPLFVLTNQDSPISED